MGQSTWMGAPLTSPMPTRGLAAVEVVGVEEIAVVVVAEVDVEVGEAEVGVEEIVEAGEDLGVQHRLLLGRRLPSIK